MWPSFLAQVKKAPHPGESCLILAPFSLPLSFSLSLSLSDLCPGHHAGVIKKGSQDTHWWAQETSWCGLICWELTTINFSEGPSKAAAAKRSGLWSMVALSAAEGEAKWWRQRGGSLQLLASPSPRAASVSCSLSPPHTRLPGRSVKTRWGIWKHMRNVPGSPGGGEVQKENSFAKNNNSNLVFTIITMMTVVVIMVGYLILSSDLWTWNYISVSQWKLFKGCCFVANRIHYS